MDTFDLKVKIDLVSGCWLWVGTLTRYGYGQVSVGGKKMKAHRVSWELHWGMVPDGLHVLHRCDVRNCVNPRHLFLGTNQDNIDDKMRKNRGTSGILNGRSKLCDSDVHLIRLLLIQKETHKEIAKKFGVHQSIVSQINTGKAWVGV